MATRLSAVAGVFVCVWFSTAVLAEEAYYRIPIEKLTITQGNLPPTTQPGIRYWRQEDVVSGYAALDGGGTCYVSRQRGGFRGTAPGSAEELVVKSENAPELAGIICLPRMDSMTLVRAHFRVDPRAYVTDRKTFLQAKLEHYRRLEHGPFAGAAWFRHEANAIENEMGQPAHESRRPSFMREEPEFGIDDTLALFGGGRAVSENLQLDRVLRPATQPDVADVKLETISGITVKQMDWSPLVAGKTPKLDRLASMIPADQHAIFFPSFESAVTLIDEAQRRGSILLAVTESGSEDAQTQARYERQLCLPLSTLGRALGPALVKSMALTGSDPYLRTGSDVAVLFEASNAGALEAALNAQMNLAQQANSSAKPSSGTIEGIGYTGLVSGDRSISSYRATLGDAIVVTNSLAQLKQIVLAEHKKLAALSAAPEYIFFRDRYKLGDDAETALIVLSDATIRRWCAPRWRIGDSRRTRAAALLSELEAQSVEQIVKGGANGQALHPERDVSGMGEVHLDRGGVISSGYGTLGFMTPIRELNFDSVTKTEADAYRRWRDSYQQNWRNYFDPIAVRLRVSSDKLAADLTVMPLIVATEYREMVDIGKGASLGAKSGDPHDSIGHFAIAINPDSQTIKGFGSMMQTFSGNLKIEPLAWLGNSAAIYADADPFWKEMTEAKDVDHFMESNYGRAPVGLYLASRSPMKLALFLTAVRGFVDQASPGLTKWETLNYDGQPYAKVTASQQGADGQDLSIYYAAMPTALVVSPSEAIVKRAIDRIKAREAATRPATMATTKPPVATTQPNRPWLGESAALRLEPALLKVIADLTQTEAVDRFQSVAWANIPILNEWKQMFPDQDPVAVEEKLFAVRLVDPRGGSYIWNEKWHTMESVNYGHPGEPKAAASPLWIFQNQRVDLGLTFENEGIRARAEVQAVGKK